MILLTVAIGGSCVAEIPSLRVAADGSRLVTAEGKDFHWIGGSAWGLAELSPEQMATYLDDRQRKGFTVIQGPIVIRLGPYEQINHARPLKSPLLDRDYAGNLALDATNPHTRLNQAALAHVQLFVDEAAKRGIYVMLAGIWGPWVDLVFNPHEKGFDAAVQDARRTGRQLGAYFADRPNVLWIGVGEYHKIAWEQDRVYRKPLSEQHLALLNAFAGGLAAGKAPSQLMTMHPDSGRSTREHFSAAPWMDFHTTQLYAIRNYQADHLLPRATQNAKPELLAEGAYEGRTDARRQAVIDARQIRQQAYWAVLDGSFGYTYGHDSLYRFRQADGSPWVPPPGRWEDALTAPGAASMRHLHTLLASLPAAGRVPDRVRPPDVRLIDDTGQLESTTRTVAAASANHAIIYIPDRAAVPVRIANLSALPLAASWYSPVDGGTFDAQGRPNEGPFATLDPALTPTWVAEPPQQGPGPDWVLLLTAVR